MCGCVCPSPPRWAFGQVPVSLVVVVIARRECAASAPRARVVSRCVFYGEKPTSFGKSQKHGGQFLVVGHVFVVFHHLLNLCAWGVGGARNLRVLSRFFRRLTFRPPTLPPRCQGRGLALLDARHHAPILMRLAGRLARCCAGGGEGLGCGSCLHKPAHRGNAVGKVVKLPRRLRRHLHGTGDRWFLQLRDH
jgi:hypothetical protein